MNSNNYVNYKSHESYSNSNNVYGQLYTDSINTNSNRPTSIPPYSSDPNNDINHSQKVNQLSQFRQISTSSPQIISSLNSAASKTVYNHSSSQQMQQISNDHKQLGNIYTSPKMDSNLSQQKGPDNNIKNVDNMHMGSGDYVQNYAQSVNNVYRQDNMPNQIGKTDPYQMPPHQGYSAQKPILTSQPNPYMNANQDNHVYSAPPVDNNTRTSYQQNYNPYPNAPTSGYGVKPQVLPPPPTRPQNEQPISSGPPRTNVLGIIPYATVSLLFLIFICLLIFKLLLSTLFGNLMCI